MAVPAEDRTAHDRLLADPRVGPDDRLLDGRVFFHMTLAAHHAVGPDPRPRLHHDPIVKKTRALDGGPLLDAGAGRDPGRRRLRSERLELVAPLHAVPVHPP